MFKRKNILITGGAGALGRELTKQLLLENPGKIVIYSRDDNKHALMEREFNDERIRYIIGDIRNYERLQTACKDIDIIIHTASLKHVERGEYNLLEYKSVIVDGAENIIKVCMNNPKIKKVVALSTDKASNSFNLYGSAKLLSDKMFVSANRICDTKFSVIRYGNVINSTGSLLTKVSKGDIIPLTHSDMSRFWITLEYASKLVLFLCNNMDGGEIFIPKIPSCGVKDFLELQYGECDFKLIGIREGEKLHESMFLKSDCMYMMEYEYFYIIYPYIPKVEKFGDYIGERFNDFDYTSDTNEWVLDDLETLDNMKNW
jgi:UDP-N-acetylglucosamine 4,6-dehydratase/5-epimerase